MPRRDEQGVVGQMDVDIISTSALRIDGYLTRIVESEFVHLGEIEVVVKFEDKEARASISVVVSTVQKNSAPIAVEDQVAVHAGETVDIDVMKNDVAESGEQKVLNPE